MISLNLFTSGKHTQPVIEALKKAKDIKLVNIYSKLPDLSAEALAKADVFIVADFGKIIPKKVLEMPKYGSLCIHPSLLPKYRGASPVQYAILNGDKETGITIFKMDEKIDHGPIITQFKEEIKDDDTAESLYTRLFAAGAKVLVTILPAWVEERIETRKQDHHQATYTKILTREDGKVNWKKSNEEIERFIRAMNPWPGAWTEIKIQNSKFKIQNKRLKIFRAHLEFPQILNSKYQILILDLVQLESKKPVTWKQFLEGYPEAKLV